MVKLFSRQTRCVGVDIGETSIKMAEVSKKGNGYQLINFGIYPLPKGEVDGEFLRDSATLSAGISSLIPVIPGNNPKIATCIAGQNVFIRYITLPQMSQKEMAEAVTIEAETLFPVPINELSVDFLKIGEVKEDGINKEEIMVVAARKNHVEQLGRVITDAGVKPAVVDIESLALLRTVNEVLNRKEKADTIAVIDIGTSSATVSVFKGQALRFTRMLPFGGFRLTKVLMDNYSLTYSEAEATKKIMNLSGDETTGLNVLLHQKTELITAHLENLIVEIRRSIEFYESRYRGEEISRLAVSGGVAQMPGLAEYVQDSIHLPVDIINPIGKVAVAQEIYARKKEIEEAGTSLAVVIGLALSEVN